MSLTDVPEKEHGKVKKIKKDENEDEDEDEDEMTSSSDNEFQRRRLLVYGLPHKCSSSQLKNLFAPDQCSSIHLSRHGFAFLTFEEDEGVARALTKNGTAFQGQNITVEYARPHAQVPITGVRRQIPFPKPFPNRGIPSRGPLASLLPLTTPTSSKYQRQQQQQLGVASSAASGGGATAGGGSSSSRATRQQGRASSRGNHQKQRLFSNHVRLINFDEFDEEEGGGGGGCAANDANTEKRRQSEKSYEIEDRYKQLFSFEHYPHIAKTFFSGLDSVSLMRCKLVCKEWHRNIQRYVDYSPRNQKQMQDRWSNAVCSIYPISPLTSNPPRHLCESEYDNPYRNVLSVKADEREIMLAVDNGNVEIYDRHSHRLTCLLKGQFSASPSYLDFNSQIILVIYVCGFGRPGRRSTSFWNIFSRTTKQLLHSTERDSEDVMRVGPNDESLYLITPFVVYSVPALPDRSVNPLGNMTKVFLTHETDKIEAFDLDPTGFAVGVVRHEGETNSNRKLMFHVWRQPDLCSALESQPADFMSNLVTLFPLLEDFQRTDLNLTKCKCLSVQLRYPQCLVLLSNTYGYFEYFEDGGKPFILAALYDLSTEVCLRILTIDDTWMHKHNIVPYDYDSSVMSAKFSEDHLVLGFGSFSSKTDGGIAIWKMEELLNENIEEEDLLVVPLPAPGYHQNGYHGHTGGVHSMHLDRYQLIASNGCVHKIVTRCIEVGDEAKKDNVLVYDFWQPGRDERRIVVPAERNNAQSGPVGDAVPVDGEGPAVHLDQMIPEPVEEDGALN